MHFNKTFSPIVLLYFLLIKYRRLCDYKSVFLIPNSLDRFIDDNYLSKIVNDICLCFFFVSNGINLKAPYYPDMSRMTYKVYFYTRSPKIRSSLFLFLLTIGGRPVVMSDRFIKQSSSFVTFNVFIIALVCRKQKIRNISQFYVFIDSLQKKNSLPS